MAGDEVVVTKAGKRTHGLDRFFASLYGKPVPGLAFFTLSLVSVQERRSFPMRVEQVVRSDAEKAASKAKAAAKKRQSRRAPSVGLDVRRAARTHPKPTCTLTPELVRITAMLDALLHLIAAVISVDLRGAGRALWQPQRPADGAAVQLAPDFQAAVRCGAVLPLHRPLCRAGSPSQVWPQGRLRRPPGAIPQRDHGGGAHRRPVCTRCNCSTRSSRNR